MKWDDHYEIIEEYNEMSERRWTYKLKIKGTDTLVGIYKDFKYARKQAKYKFKRTQKRVEKFLLG